MAQAGPPRKRSLQSTGLVHALHAQAIQFRFSQCAEVPTTGSSSHSIKFPCPIYVSICSHLHPLARKISILVFPPRLLCSVSNPRVLVQLTSGASCVGHCGRSVEVVFPEIERLTHPGKKRAYPFVAFTNGWIIPKC